MLVASTSSTVASKLTVQSGVSHPAARRASSWCSCRRVRLCVPLMCTKSPTKTASVLISPGCAVRSAPPVNGVTLTAPEVSSIPETVPVTSKVQSLLAQPPAGELGAVVVPGVVGGGAAGVVVKRTMTPRRASRASGAGPSAAGTGSIGQAQRELPPGADDDAEQDDVIDAAADGHVRRPPARAREADLRTRGRAGREAHARRRRRRRAGPRRPAGGASRPTRSAARRSHGPVMRAPWTRGRSANRSRAGRGA